MHGDALRACSRSAGGGETLEAVLLLFQNPLVLVVSDGAGAVRAPRACRDRQRSCQYPMIPSRIPEWKSGVRHPSALEDSPQGQS